MRVVFAVLLAMILAGLMPASFAQSQQEREYKKIAEVKRKAGSVIVMANDPRPLAQALCGVIRQYNWLVDYEDPPYMSDSELVDVTAPQWRATHPNSPGLRGIAGSAFEFEYEEDSATATAEGEESVLQKLVGVYNQSGNPGKFVVHAEGDDQRPWSTSHRRYAIVGSSIKDQAGQDKSVAPVLDTQISIPAEERNADETIGVILKELSSKGGAKVVNGVDPINLLRQTRVTVGGENVPARTLLLQTLRAASNPSLVWRLLYDPNGSTYYLNIGVVHATCGLGMEDRPY